jgi:hypothetical protein
MFQWLLNGAKIKGAFSKDLHVFLRTEMALNHSGGILTMMQSPTQTHRPRKGQTPDISDVTGTIGKRDGSWRWLSSGLLRRVVWQKFSGVSEVTLASIIREMSNNPEDSHLHTRHSENLKFHVTGHDLADDQVPKLLMLWTTASAVPQRFRRLQLSQSVNNSSLRKLTA